MPRIESVDCFCIKVPETTSTQWFGESDTKRLPGTNYYFEDEGYEVYSEKIESLLVRITTEGGVQGWGEVQAPIVPGVNARIIHDLLAPMILGEDALRSEQLWERMYHSMNVRGHSAGFMIDSISGIDLALWDIRGKTIGESVSALLGGRRRERLPAYVSGVPGTMPEEQANEASMYVDNGFDGVKVYLGNDPAADARVLREIRSKLGDDGKLFVDTLWRYSKHQAIDLGQRIADLEIGWLEAPVAPEDPNGHSQVNRGTSVPIAAGEQLRTTYDFDRWFDRGAVDIAQPDILRCGITEGSRIADLARTRNIPIAPHVGSSLGIGMAATWQVASTYSHFVIQEHQSAYFEVANQILESSLNCEDGELIVPDGPGLGVDVDTAALEEFVVERTNRER